MKLRSLTAAGAALAVLALPSAAAAHSNPDYRDVTSHVRIADRSLDRVTRLVGVGDLSEANDELRKHRSHIRAAVKDAGRTLRSADNTRDLRRVALGYRSVARQQGIDAAQYTQLLGSVTGSFQTQLARVLNASLSEREDVLDQLTALVDELPAGSQVGVSRWIRHLTNDGDAQVGALLGLLTQSQTAFPPNVQDLLATALELATGAVEEAMGRLDGLAAMLPAQAREPVEMALAQVQTTLTMVRGMLESFVGTLPAVSPGEVPALPDFATLLPGLQNVLPGFGGTLPGSDELLGNLTNILPALQGLIPGLGQGLPGLGGGGVPGADQILSQLGTLVPGLGDLLDNLVGDVGVLPGGGTGGGATDPVSGLLDNLLGGLLGGLLG
ncbi:MAG: hypothetical protein WD844_04505 [Thermoleophilaceae bacterium]